MYLVNHNDSIIISTDHMTLYPVGHNDQHQINMMRRGNRRKRNTEISAIWMQPQLLITAS